MKNREIYENALRILAQNTTSGENEDYEERAPYLIASFCTEAEDTDRFLRLALGEAVAATFEKVWLALEADFPLLDRLAPVACLYVAAMLILDEDGDLSDKLYERYCDIMSGIRSDIPATLESISDTYF
ncbi:MAG: hypothetical protein IJX94_00590 [Clostridia bacterium]|nr:hypothetical protein [Clostridia bacterium]